MSLLIQASYQCFPIIGVLACYFPDGTSGGPWVTDVDPATGEGTVVGVTG